MISVELLLKIHILWKFEACSSKHGPTMPISIQPTELRGRLLGYLNFQVWFIFYRWKSDISIIFWVFQPKIPSLRKNKFFHQFFPTSCPNITNGRESLRNEMFFSQIMQKWFIWDHSYKNIFFYTISQLFQSRKRIL